MFFLTPAGCPFYVFRRALCGIRTVRTAIQKTQNAAFSSQVGSSGGIVTLRATDSL